ncbi:MAG: hypothetical protein C4558_03425 [Dehalococcoidia bacterium]|nr:MAG: hypothetical protein C4558_03425 [Dehalococcoidia bacterium]
MADYPPYMNAHGNISKILDKIMGAQTPEKFTVDFVESVLGFTGGSALAIIPLLKRIAFLQSDGVPTELYRRFRNKNSQGPAMAEGMRRGYADIFKRNEYAYALDDKGLRGLIIEITGLDEKSPTVRAIAQSFTALKRYASWEGSATQAEAVDLVAAEIPAQSSKPADMSQFIPQRGFSYTIYLNLPNTTDPAVFSAIFKSLRENLVS